jgi:hypothetical protein
MLLFWLSRFYSNPSPQSALNWFVAFNDGFYFISIALLVSGLILLFCQNVKPGAGAAAH